MDNQERKRPKTEEGIVTSNKMDKTVVVEVTYTLRHPVYDKVIRRRKKYFAHSENPQIQIGDKVTIIETRPLSKNKRWRVVATELGR